MATPSSSQTRTTTTMDNDTNNNKISKQRQLLHDLIIHYPTRQDQIHLLFSLISPTRTPPSPIMVTGHTSTGKTMVVKSLIYDIANVRFHAYIDCIIFSTQKDILEEILFQLSGSDGRVKTRQRCSSLVDFIHKLPSTVNYSNEENTIHLIFDKAERLRNMESHFLPSLFCLSDVLETVKVNCIFISELPPEKFRFYGPLPKELITICFPNFSLPEAIAIIRKFYKPSPTSLAHTEMEERLWPLFVEATASVIFPSCRELREIIHILQDVWPVYLEPAISGRVKDKEQSALFLAFKPQLVKVLNNFSTRDTLVEGTLVAQTDPLQTLPLDGKFILIASYLASHVPPTLDKTLYSIEQSKKKSSKKEKSTRFSNKKQEGGVPSFFSIERMLAILYSIGGKNLMMDSSRHNSLISSLISLNLISTSRSKNVNGINEPLVGWGWSSKLICQADYGFINQVAKSIPFYIDKYLALLYPP
eukprot:TRINITY_DN5745_c0_g1_i1.p1 TRINITY_DN5745_c0_g1~~TRINITY_DN5745_c0_g1_i1.p1  ORF type:complete len:475 (+),score=63.72 TRINITY_DN5745_c0_g1_i1:599-2023(+)